MVIFEGLEQRLQKLEEEQQQQNRLLEEIHYLEEELLKIKTELLALGLLKGPSRNRENMSSSRSLECVRCSPKEEVPLLDMGTTSPRCSK